MPWKSGEAYNDLGEPRKAIEYYEQALKISREIGDRRGEGKDLGNLGKHTVVWASPEKQLNIMNRRLKFQKK